MAEMLQGQLEVHREWVHRTARGERLLVMHGDQFDGIVSCAPWLTNLGDVSSWPEFILAMKAALAAQQPLQGAGIRVLSETIGSPSLVPVPWASM